MASWRQDKRTSAQRGYGNRWRKVRDSYLQHHPLCRLCQQTGQVTAATVVDHITPHKGDQRLFWDRDNWQALCSTCHNSAKAIEEHKGTTPGHDASGIPLDPASPWADLR